MDEYIKREDAILARPEWCELVDDFSAGFNICIDEYIDKIDEIPAADVVPVKHGKWVDEIDPWDRQHIGRCSECGQKSCDFMYFHFCPNCGAKMDKGE